MHFCNSTNNTAILGQMSKEVEDQYHKLQCGWTKFQGCATNYFKVHINVIVLALTSPRWRLLVTQGELALLAVEMSAATSGSVNFD